MVSSGLSMTYKIKLFASEIKDTEKPKCQRTIGVAYSHLNGPSHKQCRYILLQTFHLDQEDMLAKLMNLPHMDVNFIDKYLKEQQ